MFVLLIVSALNLPHKYSEYEHTLRNIPFYFWGDQEGAWTSLQYTREELLVPIGGNKEVLVCIFERSGKGNELLYVVIPGYISGSGHKKESNNFVSRVQIIHSYHKIFIEPLIIRYLKAHPQYYTEGMPINYW